MAQLSSMQSLLFFLLLLLEYGRQGVVVQGVSVEEDLTITYKEKQILDKFKLKMSSDLPHEYMKSDIYLMRYLRARNFNMEQAEQMLRSNIKWRADNKMDTIGDEDWSDMKDEFHYDTDAFDKEGRPVGTLNIQNWNFRQIALTGKMPRLLRYMDKLLEEATQAVLKQQSAGKNVTQFKVILNLEGFSIIQHACPMCLPAYVQFLNSYEEHYPGFADAIVLINTPPAFQIILELARPIFTPATRKALKIFGTEKRQWMEYLDKEIEKKQRRPEFGGTKVD